MNVSGLSPGLCIPLSPSTLTNAPAPTSPRSGADGFMCAQRPLGNYPKISSVHEGSLGGVLLPQTRESALRNYTQKNTNAVFPQVNAHICWDLCKRSRLSILRLSVSATMGCAQQGPRPEGLAAKLAAGWGLCGLLRKQGARGPLHLGGERWELKALLLCRDVGSVGPPVCVLGTESES